MSSSWLDLCDDIHYICTKIEDEKIFTKAIMDVLKCLIQKQKRDSISMLGEKSLMKNSLVKQSENINVSTVGKLIK